MELDFSNQEILVIGDVMLDHYIIGQIHRQSPEADVPVVSQSSSSIFPGGAANVALNVLGLGAKVHLIGIIGNDYEGGQLSEGIKKAGINNAILIKDSSRITTRKTRIIAGDQHIVRVDQEQDDEISNSISSKVLKNIETLLREKSIDLVILQDYNKGLFTAELILKVRQLLSAAKVPYVVDPKKNNLFHYQDAHILKPNLKELIDSFTKEEIEANTDWKNLAYEMFRRCQPKLLLVTLGEAGIWSFDGQVEQSFPAFKIENPDVCGAGDAVMSMAALAECKKVSKNDLLKLCNMAGAVSCQSLGVRAVTLNDLKSFRSSLQEDKGGG